MKNQIIIHIPHSSYFIPKEYKNLFYLTDSELKEEQIKMTDSYTEELFNIENIRSLIFPVSRLVCDVERFRTEAEEEMTKRGMWVCYRSTSDLRPLKKVSRNHKKEILKAYYDKHHNCFEQLTEQKLKRSGKCLIIDAHSFSSVPLPYELHSKNNRPDICIGVDDFHTPKEITKYFCNSFTDLGYRVNINNPFCGTIVPVKFYTKNKNVMSIMIELNRSLYMNESSGNKTDNFIKLKRDIFSVITGCVHF